MNSHFKGRPVLDHLKEARVKGHIASKESHGIESQGHLIGGADAAREAALLALLLSIVASSLKIGRASTYLLLCLVLAGFFFWKVGRSASLGWARLERVNKLIADEKNEIETNREEEKSELTAMYEAKGFNDPLLSQVIDVLMADDNKLLGIMLEEELGVSLESYEHPLKQAFGTAIGLFLTYTFLFGASHLSPIYGILIAAPFTILIASAFMAKIEKIRALHAAIWNIAIAFLASATTYFLTNLLT